jgi:hypothetical protein
VVFVQGHVHLRGGLFVPPDGVLDTGIREMATEERETTESLHAEVAEHTEGRVKPVSLSIRGAAASAFNYSVNSAAP